MIPGSTWITSDFNKSQEMEHHGLDGIFEGWDPLVDYTANSLMKAEMMNPCVATEPTHIPMNATKSPIAQQLEMPLTRLLISPDMTGVYAYADDYTQAAAYSPTQSYSSSNSTDTDRVACFDQSMYKLQSPTVSDLSNITMSPQMPPSPPPPPRVYKPCVVCLDKSSGYHYTVSSCEGCKGFFRRSIQKNMQYTCHKEQQCEINKVTRNRCQYCRLNKCLSMGMSKEAVRNDRKKKKQKSQESNCSTSHQAEALTEKDRLIIETILSAHRDTYPDDDATDSDEQHGDKFNKSMLGKIIKMEIQASTNSKSPHSDNEVDNLSHMILWGRVSELSELAIHRIARFAKSVPQFLSLSHRDKITLLQAAALEIVILRLCLRYDHERDVMSFACGLSLDRYQIKACGFGTLTDEIFKLAASFRKLDVDETAMSLLSAICLVSGDRSGLENSTDVESTQDPILIALKHYITLRYPSQPRYLAKILIKLTDLRKISIEGAEEVLKLYSNCPDNFSPLLDEMLRRNENVDLSNPERLSANQVIPPEINRSSKS